MQELGGYIELEYFRGSEYHKNALRFNTVRNSIEYVITRKKYSKLYLPYYLCHSVRDMLDKIAFPYEFYPIDRQLLPIMKKLPSPSEAVLIVNYFGQINNEILKKFQAQYNNVIIDNTHAFFQSPVIRVDTVYTCRKYFGVSDGAYLYASFSAEDYGLLNQDCSAVRMGHLLGRFEHSASEYYPVFCQNDDALSNQNILKMSAITQNILRGIDYPFVLNRRKNNFNFLNEALSANNELDIAEVGTYMYPFLHPSGSKIKRILISQNIYVPTLWPNVLKDCPEDSFEYYLADNLVLLPIDQRYSEKEMNYILKHLIPTLKTC